MKYFIADTHFRHESVIEMCNRPFANVDEMDEALIRNWNHKVKKQDEVYILGDFLYKGTAEDAIHILRQLNGKKYLIRGNHEKYLKSSDFDLSLFEWVKDYYSFKENKQQWVLFHYPILEWEGYFRNSILLYGHVHNNCSEYFSDLLGVRAVNVGVDMIDFTPISQQEILTLIAEREG